MASLFLVILGISVSVGVIIIVLISLSPLLDKKYSAKWKYLIWIFLALRLLVPISGINGQLVIGGAQKQNQTVAGSKEKYTGDLTGVTAPHRRTVVEIPAQMTAPIKAQPEKNNTGITMLDIVAFVWIVGSLIFIAVHFISYFYYKRQLIKNGRMIEDVKALSQIEKLKRELHIRRSIHAMEYYEAESPMIIGFLKPIVVLIKEQYSSEELFFILKHELCHT